jgi:hypothetical protein
MLLCPLPPPPLLVVLSLLPMFPYLPFMLVKMRALVKGKLSYGRYTAFVFIMALGY